MTDSSRVVLGGLDIKQKRTRIKSEPFVCGLWYQPLYAGQHGAKLMRDMGADDKCYV